MFTSEDVEEHWRGIPATPVKNLFLRNKKGNRHYLVILGVEKRADLQQLVKVIGDDRLSFGSAERLMETARPDAGVGVAVRPAARGQPRRAGDHRCRICARPSG